MTRFVSGFSQATLSSLLGTLMLLVVAIPGVAQASDDLNKRVASANDVLEELQRIPEQAIPPNLLKSAYAVAVLPNVLKGAFFVGGSYGKGVLMVRQADGKWSNPAFIKLGNVSFGWQFGGQGADLVLVFRTPKGIDNIAQGKFTLGGSASASAGPVGRTAQAMTDGQFKSEIYAYARSRGAFVGVAVDGGVITIDKLANAEWYGSTADGDANRIFTDPTLAAPASAQPLLTTLSSMAPQVNWKASALASQAPAPATAPAASTESKTYAIEDGAAPAPETTF
ncbi:MAG: ligand-binding protein SH3 [Gammaproteobacteria bacterium]|nr:ligand-binding protein SH3 [Gammaproteobacteria bacterium]